MKVEIFGTQKMLCHFRSTTSIFCRFTRPIRQVHEPTPLITKIIAVIILKFEQHGFTVQ